MRIANADGRLVLVDAALEHAVDVERASEGRFGPCPMSPYEDWDAFCQWASEQDVRAGERCAPSRLAAPVPRPAQVFGVGLNYRDHAAEAGLDIPTEPMVFTKFPTCLTGPDADVALPSDAVDFEVELVVVLGRGGHGIPVDQAWDHVAGLTVGQDLSERRVQFAHKPPQFSMGKSYPGFGPIGPAVVTLDEIADRDALALSCAIDGETMQDGTTANLIFPVAELVARLSAIVTLLPGDLIFTGTPAGVGSVRQPRRYLRAGEVLTSRIEGIGELTTRLG